jgi:uridine phosphorylase
MRRRLDAKVHAMSETYPLMAGKDYLAPSVFEPENLLREARRQRGLVELPVPAVCLLDPDGDIVRYLKRSGRGHKHEGWACYHTEMWIIDVDGLEIGVVGMAVGAPFAVLVAEQLAVSAARLTISVTSAGRVATLREPPYFVLIDRALRDEGTSLHYQPPAKWSRLAESLRARLEGPLSSLPEPVVVGDAWTTDAPYRETRAALAAAEAEGVLCVEMEAAALYAYANARGRDVVCLAHLTNTMAVGGDDFEKGRDNGAHAALSVVHAVAEAALRTA